MVSFLTNLINLSASYILHYGLEVSFKDLKGFFELTQRPSRAHDSPPAMLMELQRYKDTVRCAALGAEVPVKNN